MNDFQHEYWGYKKGSLDAICKEICSKISLPHDIIKIRQFWCILVNNDVDENVFDLNIWEEKSKDLNNESWIFRCSIAVQKSSELLDTKQLGLLFSGVTRSKIFYGKTKKYNGKNTLVHDIEILNEFIST